MFSPVAKYNEEEADDTGAWLSISDLMSGLLMVFALLLIVALAQITQVSEQSKNTRVIIIQGINDGLSNAGIDVKADPETGDISILDSVLFAQNDYKLKHTGQEFLKQFIPVYANVIFQSDTIADEVIRIVVEGHSSSEGKFSHNMRLSVLRANSVSEYIEQMDFSHKARFFKKVLISGRGAIDANKTQALAKDRKVMFRFQFKGDEFFLQQLQGK